MLTAFALMNPWASVMVLFIPMPAIVAIGGFAAYDFYRSITNRQGFVDSAGHIGIY